MRVRAARARAERGCASGAIISFEGRLVNGEIYEQMRHAERKTTQLAATNVFLSPFTISRSGVSAREEKTSYSTGGKIPVSSRRFASRVFVVLGRIATDDVSDRKRGLFILWSVVAARSAWVYALI